MCVIKHCYRLCCLCDCIVQQFKAEDISVLPLRASQVSMGGDTSSCALVRRQTEQKAALFVLRLLNGLELEGSKLAFSYSPT